MKRSKVVVILIVAAVIGLGGGVAIGYALNATNDNQTGTTASKNGTGNDSNSNSGSATTSGGNDSTSGSNMTQTTTNSSDPDRCTADDLSASLSTPSGNGAAGSRYYTITFTNQNGTSCNLYGYPGVSLTDTTGTQIGEPAIRDTTQAESTVSLKSQQSATATMKVSESANYPSGTCKSDVTTVKIYPPNDTGLLTVPSSTINLTTWCPGFTVTAVSM